VPIAQNEEICRVGINGAYRELTRTRLLNNDFQVVCNGKSYKGNGISEGILPQEFTGK
jgi:hypothetical protein